MTERLHLVAGPVNRFVQLMQLVNVSFFPQLNGTEHRHRPDDRLGSHYRFKLSLMCSRAETESSDLLCCWGFRRKKENLRAASSSPY